MLPNLFAVTVRMVWAPDDPRIIPNITQTFSFFVRVIGGWRFSTSSLRNHETTTPGSEDFQSKPHSVSRYKHPPQNDIASNGRVTPVQKAETLCGKYLLRDRIVVQTDNPLVNARHQVAVPESGKACHGRPLDRAPIAVNPLCKDFRAARIIPSL